MDKKEYEDKLWALKKNRERIEGLDADIRQRVGSNEPLASFRVEKALQDGPKTAAEILAHARADGYQGPDSRIRDAIGRLQDEFRRITIRRGKYIMSPRSAGPANRF